MFSGPGNRFYKYSLFKMTLILNIISVDIARAHNEETGLGKANTHWI